MDGFPLLGETCALLAALNWALALVLFKRSGESMQPLSLSLFKNVVAGVLLAATLPMVAILMPDVGEGMASLRTLSSWDLLILVVSGIIGIAIADTILFYSLNMIGVGLLTIMECAYTPSVIFFAWLFLAETIGTRHYVGGGLVLFGVFLSSKHAPPPGRTRATLLWGMFLGALSVSMMAFGIVIAKSILARTSVLSATMIRLIGGTLVLGVLLALSPKRSAYYSVFRPSASWRVCIPASILGTYFAMIFWIAGYKFTEAGIAAILNQTSTILALIFAAVILKEPFTRRKTTAAALALAGLAVIAFCGPRTPPPDRGTGPSIAEAVSTSSAGPVGANGPTRLSPGTRSSPPS